MRLTLCSEYPLVNQREWFEYVERSSSGTIFHTPVMHSIYLMPPHYDPFVIVVTDEDNGIQALLTGYIHTVKQGIASYLAERAVIMQSPLYSDIKALDLLMEGYSEFIKGKAIYTEIRTHVIDEQASAVYKKHGFTLYPHLNYLINCTDPDSTWKSISESKRRQIKKAKACGVNIIEDPTEYQVREFYKILNDLYLLKVKKPLPHFEFFLSHTKYGSDQYYLKCLLIEFQDKIIGGIYCPISGKRAIHEGYIAGLDSEYKDQYPSVMATWAAIDYACRNGIEKFDFLGAGSPDKDYGVREFKARFGGELIEPGRYLKVHSQWKYNLAEQGFKLYAKLGLHR